MTETKNITNTKINRVRKEIENHMLLILCHLSIKITVGTRP